MSLLLLFSGTPVASGGGGGGGYVPYPVYPDDWEEKTPGVWTRRKKKRKPKPTDEELLRMVAMLD